MFAQVALHAVLKNLSQSKNRESRFFWGIAVSFRLFQKQMVLEKKRRCRPWSMKSLTWRITFYFPQAKSSDSIGRLESPATIWTGQQRHFFSTFFLKVLVPFV